MPRNSGELDLLLKVFASKRSFEEHLTERELEGSTVRKRDSTETAWAADSSEHAPSFCFVGVNGGRGCHIFATVCSVTEDLHLSLSVYQRYSPA